MSWSHAPSSSLALAATHTDTIGDTNDLPAQLRFTGTPLAAHPAAFLRSGVPARGRAPG